MSSILHGTPYMFVKVTLHACLNIWAYILCVFLHYS